MMNVNTRRLNVQILNKHTETTTNEVLKEYYIDSELKKAINPIIDNEKKMFHPVIGGVDVKSITFNVNLLTENGLAQTKLSDLGLSDDDVNYKRNNFTNSYLKFSFYTSNDRRSRVLLGENRIYLNTTTEDYETVEPNSVIRSNNNVSVLGLSYLTQIGKLKPISEINLKFKTTSPKIDTNTNNDSYFLWLPTNIISVSETIYYTVEFTSGVNGFTYLLGNKNGPSALNEVMGTITSSLDLYDDLNTKPIYSFSEVNDINLVNTDGHITLNFYEITSN